MKKSQLVAEFKEGVSAGGAATLMKLIDVSINECHSANESNRGEEFLITQGEIKGLKKLQTLLTKKKKLDK